MTLIRPWRNRWRLDAPVPVGPLETLADRLLADAAGDAVVLGCDFPIGLPRAYAAQYGGNENFLGFLKQLRNTSEFFQVCAELTELHPGRPFYPMRGRAGMTRAAHADALGLPGARGLSRDCDQATARRPAGAPLFWTLGANQTGKAAISAWSGFLLPSLPRLRLWPFEGDLLELAAPGMIVVAETYPAEAVRHFAPSMPGSKRRQTDRRAFAAVLWAVLKDLRVTPAPAAHAMIDDGFGADPMGEDRFDSVLGALCALNVMLGNRPDTVPEDPWLRRWEGWVLGQTDLPRQP